MKQVKEFFNWLKANPGKVAVIAVVASIFLSGMIVGLYNKLRDKTKGADGKSPLPEAKNLPKP
jgi:hypothetical protein